MKELFTSVKKIMRKYFFGILAFAFAIGLSAFNSKNHEIKFEFIGTTETHLENPDYWILAGQTTAMPCNEQDDETCSLVFDDAIYDQEFEILRGTGYGLQPYMLRSTFEIEAVGDQVVSVSDHYDYELSMTPSNNTSLIIEP